MPGSSPVTVVIVSYNTCEKLRKCLSAIEPEHAVVVVDNASTDGSRQMVEREYPHVEVIPNATNRGFGAANNQGSEGITTPFTLFLNSDAYARPGAIERLALEMEKEGVVAAGGRLLNPDGSLQESSANRLTLWAVFCEQTLLEKLFPNSSLFSPYWNSRRFERASDVEQVMGACLMIRTHTAAFDERFFLYVEDTDLCLRLRKLGTIRYVPEAQFVHDLGSSSTSRWQAVARYNRGKELYFEIHHGSFAAFLCFLMDRGGALLRLLIWGIPTLATLGFWAGARRRAALFWRVLSAPKLGPGRP